MLWCLSTLKGLTTHRCSLVADLPWPSAVCQNLWSMANWSRCVWSVSTLSFSSFFPSSCLHFRYKLVCVFAIDHWRPSAAVRWNPEGRDFYWGEERCNHISSSVSIHMHTLIAFSSSIYIFFYPVVSLVCICALLCLFVCPRLFAC